jgi:hypothetical protein
MFYSGCDLLIPTEFQGGKGKRVAPGIYKLNSIKSSGTTKLTRRNGDELESGIGHLVKVGFQVAEYTKEKQRALAT